MLTPTISKYKESLTNPLLSERICTSKKESLSLQTSKDEQKMEKSVYTQLLLGKVQPMTQAHPFHPFHVAGEKLNAYELNSVTFICSCSVLYKHDP